MPTEIFVQEHETKTPFTSDDRIFLGEGLFETLKVSKAKPCYFELHWQRLKKTARLLEIPFTLSLKSWHTNLNRAIHLKQIEEGGIKVILGAGKAARGLLSRAHESRLILNAFQYIKPIKPLILISAPWQRDAKNPLYQFKSINYLEAIIARREAEAAGAEDVLFFNSQHQACETTIANFFIIKNDELFTPPLKSGLLPGIIRERLISLCKEQGINCFETELSKVNLIQADAAFTTNALQGLRAISSWDGHFFDCNHPFLQVLQTLLIRDCY